MWLEMLWLITRYTQQIAVGGWAIDLVDRPPSEVYAAAEIIEQPRMLDKQPDIEYWLEKSWLGTKPQALVRFTKQLLNTPLLDSLSVVCRPNTTNYKVTSQEGPKLHEIINAAI